jgi:Kef-type K+ transport system membrane component KefB/K+/H+ antiporter YhaU regulatory subunit KhtT
VSVILREICRRTFGNALWVYHANTGACNGYDIVVIDVLTPFYDAERFGIRLVGSPRHADAPLVCGPVTRQSAPAPRRLIAAVPRPRLVFAVGSCACGGGTWFDTYNALGGAVGIALLLFVVGLKLDVTMVRTVGPVALATGVGQVVFTSVIGFFITLALGFAPLPALYIAVALTFSSTIIIVKLLSDKREIDALHGRIAVGFLIVQDVAVILAMIGLTALGAGTGAAAGARLASQVLRVIVTGAAFLGVLLLVMRWGLPRLVAAVARSSELLVLFGIAWALALAALGERLGFSREVGAFLAGVALASTPYREAIAGRLVSVRDFLLLFFFIDLGARLDLSLLGATVVPSLVLSAFVLVGNPLIVMAIMGAMAAVRRRRRAGRGRAHDGDGRPRGRGRGRAGLGQVRLSAGSAWAGHTLAELRVRERFRVTALAVSRAGHTLLNPAPDHRLFPGDRIILSGEAEGLRAAAEHAAEIVAPGAGADDAGFAVGEVAAAAHATWPGQTLSQLELRNRFGVTVAGIKQPGGDVLAPTGDYVVHRDDRLVVAGQRDDVERLAAGPPGPATRDREPQRTQ